MTSRKGLSAVKSSENDAILAEVSLDESEFSGGEERASLTRVEVEVADEGAGSYDEVAGFVGWLRSSLELRPTATSSSKRGSAPPDSSRQSGRISGRRR